jgi:hypothetical protein
MDKIIFADSWNDYFSAFGLRSFDDFYDYKDASHVNRNKRRNVRRFTLKDAQGEKSFYIKRFHGSHLKDKLAAAIRFGWGASQARVEWENARYLLNNGFATYVPVCYGESNRGKSFIVTIELDAVCLQKYVIEKWLSLSRPVQDKIIIAVAEMIRRVHSHDISLPDLFIWHLFVQPNSVEGEIELSVIDLHRMRTSVKSKTGKIKELSTFYWSMSGEYFDERHKNLLVATYWGSGDILGLIKKISKHEARLNRKRILKHHYKLSRFASAVAAGGKS